MAATKKCGDLATYTFPFSLSFVLFIHNHFSFNLHVGTSQHVLSWTPVWFKWPAAHIGKTLC